MIARAPVRQPWRARAPVLELIGPAAAGKSTLVTELQARAATMRGPLAVWGLPRSRLIAHGLRLMPTFLRLARDPRPPALAELAHLVRLEALQEAVERERSRSPGPILIDEGPVFALTWMEVFYPDRNGPRFAAWRAQTLAEWARTLDFVISIDAPDPALLHRIRTRPKEHAVKDAPDDEVRAFTARFRTAFGHVLGDLRAHGGPEIVTFVTGNEPRERTVERVLQAISEAADGD